MAGVWLVSGERQQEFCLLPHEVSPVLCGVLPELHQHLHLVFLAGVQFQAHVVVPAGDDGQRAPERRTAPADPHGLHNPEIDPIEAYSSPGKLPTPTLGQIYKLGFLSHVSTV